jgi:hypothetical protein
VQYLLSLSYHVPRDTGLIINTLLQHESAVRAGRQPY